MRVVFLNLKHIVMCCLMLLVVNFAYAQEYQAKHEVKRGETIASIAKRYGVTEQMIKEANPQAGDLFYVGLKLNIPLSKKTGKEVIEEKVEKHNETVEVSSNSISSHYVPNNGINYDIEGVDNFFI